MYIYTCTENIYKYGYITESRTIRIENKLSGFL